MPAAVQIGIHLAHEQRRAARALGHEPGAGEVVLHHGHITVGGVLFDVDLVLLDVENSTFWYFLASV